MTKKKKKQPIIFHFDLVSQVPNRRGKITTVGKGSPGGSFSDGMIIGMIIG